MRKAGLFALWSIVATICLFWLYLGGCNDRRAFAPDDTPPPEEYNYPVYFSDPTGCAELMIFNPETRLIDSIDVNWRVKYGLTVSPDGKRLYVVQRNSLVVADTDSFSVITELPYVPNDPVAVSPDNQLVAIASNDGLHILNTANHEVVFHDSTQVSHCEFSSNSKTLYCAKWLTNFVYKVDLSGPIYTVSQKEFADGLIRYVVPSPDESKWFIYLQFHTFNSAFEVYDVASDSVIFRDFLVPGYGQIAVTPDGKYAFYTNPGRSGTDPPAPPAFTIFDVEANKIDRVVSEIDFFSGTGDPCISWLASPNDMAITPDGRWLSILGGSLALTVLYLYDIQTEQLVHREDWGGCSHYFSNLTVQNTK